MFCTRSCFSSQGVTEFFPIHRIDYTHEDHPYRVWGYSSFFYDSKIQKKKRIDHSNDDTERHSCFRLRRIRNKHFHCLTIFDSHVLYLRDRLG